VIAQREFRREFWIHRNRTVPSVHAIKTWVRNFEATGPTLNKKAGSVKTVRTPKNIAVVKVAIERSPHRPARRHSVPLGLSEASVRQVLHKDLHFNPYKIQVTHALHERDYVNRVNFCQTSLQFEIHAERTQNCHHFCKTLSQQKHVVLQSTAPMQLKRFKSWQQNGDSGILPSVAKKKKKSVAKSPDSLTHPVQPRHISHRNVDLPDSRGFKVCASEK
jgi:hypothetical protein